MRPSAGGHGLDLPEFINAETISQNATHAATRDRSAQVGGSVKPKGARKRGAVEPEELITIGNAPRVLVLEPVAAALDGVSVVLEP